MTGAGGRPRVGGAAADGVPARLGRGAEPEGVGCSLRLGVRGKPRGCLHVAGVSEKDLSPESCPTRRPFAGPSLAATTCRMAQSGFFLGARRAPGTRPPAASWRQGSETPRGEQGTRIPRSPKQVSLFCGAASPTHRWPTVTIMGARTEGSRDVLHSEWRVVQESYNVAFGR